MSERAIKERPKARTSPKGRFIKKSISYPPELIPYIKARMADPQFRGVFSIYISYLIACDKERGDRGGIKTSNR